MGGLRFLSLISFEDLMLSAVLGKNLRCHQPFDLSDNFTKSVNDPRPIKEQATANVIVYFMPKFIIESMLDLIKDSEGNSRRHVRIHTLTYKEPNAPLAPLISNQLLKLTPWKKPQKGTMDIIHLNTSTT